jgi:hypothetical protein
MSAIDNARAALAKLDDYKRTLEGRVSADDLADALRDLIAEHERLTASATQEDREALHSALVGVVSNASNYPRAVQARLLGQNLGVFRALLVETVLAAGFRRPEHTNSGGR